MVELIKGQVLPTETAEVVGDVGHSIGGFDKSVMKYAEIADLTNC